MAGSTSESLGSLLLSLGTPSLSRDLPVCRHVPRRPAIQEDFRGYLCPVCDVLLDDGAIYETCPVCGEAVDWVDVRRQIWACPTCDRISNLNLWAPPYCPTCQRYLAPVENLRDSAVQPVATPPRGGGSRPATASRDSSPERRGPMLERLRAAVFSRRGLAAIFLLALIPVEVMALDSGLRWLVIALAGPLVLLPILGSVVFLGSLAASIGALLEFVRDRVQRVVHGLEHGTIKLLLERGVVVEGGLTHGSSFELYLGAERGSAEAERAIELATRDAIGRIWCGERELAYDPRCGTSALVAAFVLSVLGLAAGVAGLFFHLQLVTLVTATTVLAAMAVVLLRPLGLLAQRRLTVSTDFRSAIPVRVVRRAITTWRVTYEVQLDVDVDASPCGAPYR